ncbi:DUF3793 family protein [Clostridium aciditolerans]|uniref:DUF3793 family protein n=1 Tax=Clostridium aciditolerans TaxID=339861 RepID=A0A934HUV1_9CLOT|nr:DUF3793 family protein [Clostridium aciditolerans]MBI6874715.1 DUF3793 family protein [Clostridium aciditolerans]
MVKEKLNDYINIVKNFNEKDYLFSTIAHSIGPTLVGEKPSSLLIFNKYNRNQKKVWGEVKHELKGKLKIKFFELNTSEESSVVLFYDENMLLEILKKKRNIYFLKKFGYRENMSLQEYLTLLSQRFKKICPHEIGIFLGYPVEDVAIFSSCPNRECLLVGYWKVYHNDNVEKAKNIFKRYDSIKSDIIKLIAQGVKPIEIISSYKILAG